MHRAGTPHTGEEAEREAEAFLQRQGLRVLMRNYRCRGGEIDLIARDRDTLVFVEVRLRRHTAFGGPLASVDRRKQKRLTIAAQHYLQHDPWTGPCRFDVIGIDATEHCEWIRDAFAAG